MKSLARAPCCCHNHGRLLYGDAWKSRLISYVFGFFLFAALHFRPSDAVFINQTYDNSAFLSAQEIADLRWAFPLCLVNMPNETVQQPIVRISVNVSQLNKPGERLQVSLDSARLGVLFNSVFITAQYIDPDTNTRVFGKIDCGRGRWLSDKRPFTPAVTTCEAAETMPPASGAVLNSGRNSLSSVRFLWDAPDGANSSTSTSVGENSAESVQPPLQLQQQSSVFQYISFLVVVWSDAKIKWVLAWRTPPIRMLYMPAIPSMPPIVGPVTSAPSMTESMTTAKLVTPTAETLNLYSKLLGIENCLLQLPAASTLPPLNSATTVAPRVNTVVDISDMTTPAIFSLTSNKSSVSMPGERVPLKITSNFKNATIDSVVIATAVIVARRGMPPYLKGVEGSWVPGDASETVLCNGYVAIRTKPGMPIGQMQFLADWLAPSVVTEKIFIISAVVSSGGTAYKLPPLAIAGPGAAVSTASLSGDGLNTFLSTLRSICGSDTLPSSQTPGGDWPPPTNSFGQALPFRIEAVPAFVRDDIISGSKSPSTFNISVVGLGDSDNFRFIFIQCRPAEPTVYPSLPSGVGTAQDGPGISSRRSGGSSRRSQRLYHPGSGHGYRRRQYQQASRPASIGYWRSADQSRIRLRNGPCIDSALVTNDVGSGMHSAAFQLHLLPTTQGDLMCRMILGKDNATYWSTEYPLYRSVGPSEGSNTTTASATTLAVGAETSIAAGLTTGKVATTPSQQRVSTAKSESITTASQQRITTVKSESITTASQQRITTAKSESITTAGRTGVTTKKSEQGTTNTPAKATTAQAAVTTASGMKATTAQVPITTAATGPTKARLTTRASGTTLPPVTDPLSVVSVEVAKCLLPPMMVDLFDGNSMEMISSNATNNPYSLAVAPTALPQTDSTAKVVIVSSDSARPIAALLVFTVWMSPDGKVVNNVIPAGSLQLDSSATSNIISSFSGDTGVQCEHPYYGHINGIASITPGLVEIDAIYSTPRQWDIDNPAANLTGLKPAIMGGILGGGKLWNLNPVLLTLTSKQVSTVRSGITTTVAATTRQGGITPPIQSQNGSVTTGKTPAAATSKPAATTIASGTTAKGQTTATTPKSGLTTARAAITTKSPSGISTTAASTASRRTTTIAALASDGLPSDFIREAAACLLPESLGGIASAYAFVPYSSPSNPFRLGMQPPDAVVSLGSAANVSVVSANSAYPIFAYLMFAVWLAPTDSTNTTWTLIPSNDSAGVFTPGQETSSFVGDDPELTRVRCSNGKYGNIIGLASLAPNLLTVDAQWFAPLSLPPGNYNFSSIKPGIFAGIFADQKLWEARPLVVTLRDFVVPTVAASTTTTGRRQTTIVASATTATRRPQTTMAAGTTLQGSTTATSKVASSITTGRLLSSGAPTTAVRSTTTKATAINATMARPTSVAGSTSRLISSTTVPVAGVTTGGTTKIAAAATTTKVAAITSGKSSVAAATTTAAAAATTVPVSTRKDVPAMTTTGKGPLSSASPTTLKQGVSALSTSKPTLTFATSSTISVESSSRPLWTNETTQSTIVEPTVPLSFDCRRHNHDCKLTGGFCDTDTGKCRCTSYYSAYDCRVLNTLVRDGSACNDGNGCGRGEGYGDYCLAVGRDRDGSKEFTQCSCNYGSYGPDCNRSRVELMCAESAMTVTINPFPSFSIFEGHIFMINHTSDVMVEDDLCRFNATNMTYTFSLPYETLIQRCGGEKIADNAFAIRFVIQNHPHWLTAYDQILSAKCILTVMQPYEKSIVIQTNGNVRLYSGANALSNLPENFIVGEHTRIIPRPIPQPLFSLRRVNFDPVYGNFSVAPVVGPVKIGDTVMFSIENTNWTIYSTMRTEDCTLTMDNSIEMKLITRACPASRAAWTLLRWDKTIVTNSTTSFWLRLPANALSGWPRQIDIYCRVKLCLSDSSDQCEINNSGCRRDAVNFLPSSVTLKNYGRRRRREALPSPATIGSISDSMIGNDDEAEKEPSTPVVYATVHYSFQLAVDEDDANNSSSNHNLPANSQKDAFNSLTDGDGDGMIDFTTDDDLAPLLASASADALKHGKGALDHSKKSSTTKASSSSPSDVLASSLGLINQWLLIGLMFVVFLLIAAAGLIFYLSYRLRHSQAYTLSTAG